MAAEPTTKPTCPDHDPILEIRPLHLDHLTATAALHAEHLPNGLFPALGQRFLHVWHATFLDSDHACAAVVVDTAHGDKVVGYLLLALHPLDHVHELKRTHRRQLLGAGIPALIRRPKIAIHFVRTRALRYASRLLARRPCRTANADPEPIPAVVHAVVTDPGWARKCVATRLLTWARLRAAEAHVSQLALVTDIPSSSTDAVLAPDRSQGAAAMYEHLGWRRVADRQRDGRTLVEFRTDLVEGAVDNA